MKTVRKALFSLTAAALIALSPPMARAEEDGCGASGSWAEFHTAIVSIFPEAKEHTLSGEAKDKIIAHYNATPPVSAVTPDNVRSLTYPENPVALIVLERQSCLVGWTYMSVALLRLILEPRLKGPEI